jgi:Tol biopolymer transport system component
MTRPALVLGMAVLALSALAPGQARAYDPGYRWRTLHAPHFRVHYHQGEEALAQEVAQAAERAHAALVPVLGYAPRGGTEVVLSDDVDDANGSATPFPRDTIRLYAATPPSLSELAAYRDWLTLLVFHEYVHILHLDHVGGLPAAVNRIFGKVFPPNAFVPSWMTEGLAVLHEADGQPEGPAGRNGSALHAMYTRALCAEPPGFPSLPQASNPSLDWPGGDVPYLLGGRFMAFLQAQRGDPAIAGFVAEQGSQLWPYAPSHAGARWFGKDFSALWQDYAAAERATADATLARVRARPVTHPRRLTFEGGRAGWPRWAPDGGAVAYLKSTLDGHPGLYRVTPDGRPLGRVLTVDAPGGLALGPAGDAVLSMGAVWRQDRVYDDLWRVSLAAGTRTRLTDGARASEPALTPDGAAVVYVRRTGPGGMGLFRRALGGERPGAEERLFERAGAQVYAPAVSPDGRAVAFELHEGGRRDVVLLEDGRLTRVTDDAALDLDPTFTPDGKWLLFSSDRSGVYDLYAWPLACAAGAAAGAGDDACALRQVTNVESGAFQPAVSPDGTTIAFVTYSRDGFDLASVPFDPASWLEPEPAPAAAPLPARPAAELPSTPYRPSATLAPTYWLPVFGSDAAGPVFGALTSGGDVVGRHLYAAQGWWSAKGRDLGYSVAYLGGWSFPQLDLGSSRFLASAHAGRRLEAEWTPLDAGLDFTFPGLAATFALRVGWSGTFYDVLGVQGSATQPEQLQRADGFLSQLSFSAAYSDARRPVRGISPEEGHTLGLTASVGVPELGSDFALTRVRGSAAQYLRVPFTRHSVLALRLAGGAADHTVGTRAPFALGGVARPDVAAIILSPGLVAGDELRGYPSGWFEGSGFALANAELRLPVASPELGRTTWPVFLRRIHGAVFADLGETFDVPGALTLAGNSFRTDDLRLGVGAEARLEVALGYYVLTDVRLGVAGALGRVFRGETREPGVNPVTVYLTVGQGF